MVQYSVLFQEDDYVYCEVYCDGVSTNIKVTHEEYTAWKQDKVEV